jgi:hypothetical protein
MLSLWIERPQISQRFGSRRIFVASYCLRFQTFAHSRFVAQLLHTPYALSWRIGSPQTSQ